MKIVGFLNVEMRNKSSNIFLSKFSYGSTVLENRNGILNLRLKYYISNVVFQIFARVYFKLFESSFEIFDFLTSSLPIDRFRAIKTAVEDPIVPIIQNRAERARSLSGPELSFLSRATLCDVHKRDLRCRKISFDRFEISFRWRDSAGNRLSRRARASDIF